ncbi:hypothetical protein COO59_04240 [Mixta theicola]|uniref:DUF1460 domain-containing protein n=1 Tax=Mixta theicola TaxID=1458355 RepID=A0A2K1QDN5_9GAMM|nr:DUF1460 domain-containing protein [Mixta theicola]PNS13126.1 hypothetical protein COO59_04240 [Mixta theicola]GLR09397.1 membrane protein [Mixta theicola]
MKIIASILLAFSLSACTIKPCPLLDKQTSERLDEIIQQQVIPAHNKAPGEKIADISAAFLGTPYQENTLMGSDSIPEQLVVNFNGVDCFTLLDYVAALSHASSRNDFFTQLRLTRYHQGQVSFTQRKHFFSDWFSLPPVNARDITDKLNTPTVMVIKQLNLKADGVYYLPGVPVTPRTIHYIPTNNINKATLQALQTGDYLGIYSPLTGLDVSHTGIVIKKDNQVWLRNASSLKINNKVVDTPLLSYIKSRPGIVVARPL